MDLSSSILYIFFLDNFIYIVFIKSKEALGTKTLEQKFILCIVIPFVRARQLPFSKCLQKSFDKMFY